MRCDTIALILGVCAVCLFLRALDAIDPQKKEVLLQVPTSECREYGYARAETQGGEWYCVLDGRDGQVREELARLEERNR